MAIAGLRHTNNFVTDGRPKNWREIILRSYPNGKMPLTGLTSQMKSRSVDDPEFNWWEKKMWAGRVALAADAPATLGTTLTLASGALAFKIGDILLAEQTNEQMRVVANPTVDTTLEVVRAFAGTSQALVDHDAAGVNPFLLKIGSVYEEGSNSPKGIAYDPVKRFNYTQIFQDTLEMTRTAQKTKLRTGDQVAEAKRECLEQHGISMERAFFWGKRTEGTINGKPARTLGGIVNTIDSNNIATATAAGCDMDELEEFMFRMFVRGSDEKVAICGNRALMTINQIVRKNSSYQWSGIIKEYGMNVQRLITPFGTLVFKTHPLFNEMPGGVTAATAYVGWDSACVVLDMKELQYVYLNGSDTMYRPKLEENDLDGMKSGYLTECSMEMHHPDHHFLLKGLIKAAVDN